MDKFIIPQEKSSIIAHFENNKIQELGKIDIPFLSKTVITVNGYIVSICFGSKLESARLKIFDINGNLLLTKKEYKYESIACKNNVVYLGGQYISNKSELFALIDFSDTNFSLKEINLPIQTMNRKSIDDILIRDNTLFLVDNIIFPKYIFQYEISSPENPVHIATEGLENNGTYEHIEKGEINNDWMILFSQCVGRNGISQYISIFGKNHSTLSFYVYIPEYKNKKLVNKSKEKGICDISLLKNYLIVLFEDGVKYLNLNKKIKKDKFKKLINLTGNTIKDNYAGEIPHKIENRLLKISDKHCLLLSRNKYEILKLPKLRAI
jgi:hypothetical protein